MLKTVWLKNILNALFMTKDSAVNSSAKKLLTAFELKNANMYLFEPNGKIGIYAELSENLKLFDSKKNCQTLENIYRKICDNNLVYTNEGFVYLPLKLEDSKVFGLLEIKNNKRPVESELTNMEKAILQAFSKIIYSESLGSITTSYYKTVISIKDLCVKYKAGRNTTVAVNNLNLDICENEFTLILGASGCGKTSLLNTIGSMLTPNCGSIIYNGVDVTKFSKREATNYRKNVVGFIFQQYNLISDLTVKENIEIASSLVKDSYTTEEVLDLVGLSDKAKNYPGQLSGGQQQRVCIARALVKKPKLLLCDEPTGALNSENATHIMQILKDLVNIKHVPVVMITHNSNFAALADHCVLMSNGQVIEERRQPFALQVKDLIIQ